MHACLRVGHICTKKAGVKKLTSTKIELSHSIVSRLQGLDDLARILFPGSRLQQKVFLTIFIELKYAPDQFLPSLNDLCVRYDFSSRTLETVRSKMRRLGLIDHVCRFNHAHGYREGWVFSSRFARTLARLSAKVDGFKESKEPMQERKDRDLFRYL